MKIRTTRDVFFIDASEEYEKRRNQNFLTEENIIKIVETYKKREFEDKFAYKASFEEIKENDYNLNIPRYVDTFEEETPVDMALIGKEMKNINEKKKELKSNLLAMINEMTHSKEDEVWIKGAVEVLKSE